jgi:phosphatidylglycerophosphate synthase
VSALGAHFDEEVDAFLILVLSVFVAHALGWWVLTIGLAHYAVVVAAWWLPWLRQPMPPRYWNKVVAAIQSITLTVVAADVLPRSVAEIALSAALALLTESFGREVRSHWRQRHPGTSRFLVVAERGQRVH